jgi:hypothetical protein
MQVRKPYFESLDKIEGVMLEWTQLYSKSVVPRLEYLASYGARYETIKGTKGDLLKEFEGAKELTLQNQYSKIEKITVGLKGLLYLNQSLLTPTD